MKTCVDGKIREMTPEEIAGLPNTEPVFTPPRMQHLEPDQFWFVVRASGHERELRDWIAGLNDPQSPTHDPMAWAAASAKLDYAKYFERDHALVEAARVALGMSAEELDALWTYAAFGLEPTI